MFEYRIQKAWAQYKKDYGLSRIALYICFYNCFLFFLSGVVFEKFNFLALYPVAFALLFYFLRPAIIKMSPNWIFFFNTLPLAFTVTLDYYLIGQFDRSVDLLKRQDLFLATFDQWLWGKPVALVFQDILHPLGILGQFFYDLLMISYFSYYILPFVGGILFFNLLPKDKKYKMGRYFSSMVLYFSLNYLLYLSIPVTGPQYWLRHFFQTNISFGPIGRLGSQLLTEGQTTFIDCFPSGHLGISLLVTLWLFKMNHGLRFVMLFLSGLIMLATLALRFHYTLDLVFAFPLALFCYRAAWILFPTQVSPIHFRNGKK
jgi:hypothetical protein